jgi:hypothetical protein
VEAEFLEMLADTCTIAPWVSTNEFGEFTRGAAVSFACRYQPMTQKILSLKGEELISSGILYVNRTTAVDSRDELTLPDGSKPRILRPELIRDELGPHHVRIYT